MTSRSQQRIFTPLSISIFISVVVIIAIFAILTGTDTRNLSYAEINIPYGKTILAVAATWVLLVGFIRRVSLNSLPGSVAILIALLALLFFWGKLGATITGRDYERFDLFFLMFVSGLLIGGTRYQSIVNSGIIFSSGLIAMAIFAIGLSPLGVGVYFVLDPEVLQEVGKTDVFFLRNSGILLNNNTAGSVIACMIAYLYGCNFESDRRKLLTYSIFALTVACILSGNATGSILSVLLFVFNQSRIFSKSRLLSARSLPLVGFFLVVALVFTFSGDYIAYKLESGAVKMDYLLRNFSGLDFSNSGVFFGYPSLPAYSESTMVDFFYYFGLPGSLILLFLLLWPVVSRNFKRGHTGFSGSSVRPGPFIFTLAVLLIAQNSALLPPISFLFGLVMAGFLSKGTSGKL